MDCPDQARISCSVEDVRAALGEPIPACLSPLAVGYDGSFLVTVDGHQARRYFVLADGQLCLTKIAVVDLAQGRGLATAVTLFVMDRLAQDSEVLVTGLQPPGRAFWDALAAKGYVRILTTTGREHTVRMTDAGSAFVRSLPPHQPPRRRWWQRGH